MGVGVSPLVGLGPGEFVFSIVGDTVAVGASGVWVGIAADKARVGNAVWALVAVEFCQKKMPPPRTTISTKIMRRVRKAGRDEFTVWVPIQIIVFRRSGVRCG